MKWTLASICIAAVLGLGILGPFMMGHGADHSGHCPIAALNGTSCQLLVDVLGHLGVIVGAVQGVVPQQMMISLIVILLVGMVFAVVHRHLVPPQMLFARLRHEHASIIGASRRIVLRWASLLEHSPTLT